MAYNWNDEYYYEYDDYYQPYPPPRKPMKFEQLPLSDKARFAKQEFQNIIRSIFEQPETLKTMIADKKLTVAQAKAIIKSVNKLNAMDCGCCRRFDAAKLPLPIQKELDPIINIAYVNVRTKNY
jgi:hypothetical protein